MDISDANEQQRVLTALKSSFPSPLNIKALAAAVGSSADGIQPMLALLRANELITCIDQTTFSGPWLTEPRITSRGLSHIRADGGLGATLSTVTVTFDAATLQALIAARIDASNLPATEKSALRKSLSSITDAALRELTKALVEGALNRWPDALPLLRTLLG